MEDESEFEKLMKSRFKVEIANFEDVMNDEVDSIFSILLHLANMLNGLLNGKRTLDDVFLTVISKILLNLSIFLKFSYLVSKDIL